MFGRKKTATQDFDVAKMPHNRWQAFCDVYRTRFLLIVKMGLILLLFFLPIAAVVILTNLRVYETQIYVQAGTISEQQGMVDIFGYINAGNLMMIAALIIFAIGLAGVCGVIRRLVWQEGILFGADFAKSIKQNAFAFCLTSAIGGLLNYLLQFSLRNMYFSPNTGAEIAAIASIAATALFAPTALFILAQSTIYNLKYHKKALNGFLLSMRTAYITFPVVIINVAPFLLLLIPSEYIFLPLLVLLPLFAIPALVIADTFYCDFILDKFVNKANFPQIYDKGIYRNADNKNS